MTEKNNLQARFSELEFQVKELTDADRDYLKGEAPIIANNILQQMQVDRKANENHPERNMSAEATHAAMRIDQL